MSQSHAEPQEGAALEAARSRAGLSQNEAARRAGVSGTRWRQIVRGVQSTGGARTAVRGPADTVADMALAVGLSPEELEDAGRDDAAEELRRRLAPRQGRIDIDQLRAEVERALAELPPARRARLEQVIAAEDEALVRAEKERMERWAEVVRLANPNSD